MAPFGDIAVLAQKMRAGRSWRVSTGPPRPVRTSQRGQARGTYGYLPGERSMTRCLRSDGR